MFLRNIVVYPTVECTHIAMLIKPSLLLLLLCIYIYDNVSGQGSICRQWDFLHESCYPQQVWVEGIIFSKKEKNAAEVMIFPLPQIFFLAIKWPWLVKLLADNMLNIVLKRKREFLDFFRFFSKNSNFWKKFKYVIWSIVYPWKATKLTVKMSMISLLIYQV